MTVIAIAMKLTDNQLRDLAAAEWRSRNADRLLYHAAADAMADLGTQEQWARANGQAMTVVVGRDLGVEVETLAKDAVLAAALEAVHGEALPFEQRSILRRAFRQVVKVAAETP